MSGNRFRFRAWDGRRMIRPWVYDGRLFEYGGCGPVENETLIPELMQSTGLRDKNGVEVFEGDVVLSPMGTAFIVSWLSERACFGVGTYPITHFGISTWQEYEVIGNRFENPELLEEAE